MNYWDSVEWKWLQFYASKLHTVVVWGHIECFSQLFIIWTQQSNYSDNIHTPELGETQRCARPYFVDSIACQTRRLLQSQTNWHAKARLYFGLLDIEGWGCTHPWRDLFVPDRIKSVWVYPPLHFIVLLLSPHPDPHFISCVCTLTNFAVSDEVA